MTEAVSAVIERFLRRMPQTDIHSGAFADNQASLRIQEKLGFQIQRCSDIYSLSRNAMLPHLETRLSAENFQRP